MKTKNIKINDYEIIELQVKEDTKEVVSIGVKESKESKDLAWIEQIFGVTPAKDKYVDKKIVSVKCDEKDNFDKYVGSALVFAYTAFGSKAEFRKFVDNNAVEINKTKKSKDKEAKKDE